MIIGDNREAVIENIKKAAESGEFHSKVETGDPVLTKEESNAIVNGYLNNRKKLSFKIKNVVARKLADIISSKVNKDTEIVGLENLEGIEGGAVVTSNHFSPLDNTVIRTLTRKLKKKRINIISQETNFAMKGFLGFLMNYADIIPINDNRNYLMNELPCLMKQLVQKDEYVLIYPEQEMWFNYRKPRPCKRGAYFYAAKLGVPIIPCFIELRDQDEEDAQGFYKVKYILHVLPVIYPDKDKSVKENSLSMCATDYRLKKEVYERVYGRELSYDFSKHDIAGWMGTDSEESV